MFMSTPDEQIRLNILEFLYKRATDNPDSSGVDRAIIQAVLQMPVSQMDANMTFLEEKNLVTLSRMGGSQWTFAKITGEGIEVVENKERFATKLSVSQTATEVAQRVLEKSNRRLVFPSW